MRQIPPYPTQALLERVRQWAAPDGRRPEEFAVVFGTEIRGSQARRGCISSLWEFRNATASILTPTSIPPIPSQTQHRTPPLMPKPSSLNQPSPHAVLPKPIPHVPSSPSHPTQTVPLQPHPLQPQPPYTTLPTLTSQAASSDALSEAELLDGWDLFRDSQGNPFYANRNTRVTQWERPSKRAGGDCFGRTDCFGL